MLVNAILTATAAVLLRDLQRFPANDVVTAQSSLYKQHTKRLRFYRAVYGWSNGQWDTALEANKEGVRYWHLLHDARWAPAGFGPVWRVGRQQELRRLIGEERYRAGWHPVYYPEELRQVPYWEVPE